ncbi:hypothetical protein ANCDUO_03207 [Ancylostoma duodenale]|uniref:Uncharacterized protein n=1 Tax=Ancylostoma duodenale TaxID=51022 RepID=A0A0C2GY88_9BILA|nr:hypothetical protein ANCDUO_03207 [Ancylostoma duodenale]
MREVLNILYCHGLGSSINNRVGTGLVEYFRNTPHHFERLLYRNPGSRHIPWNVSEWREDIEKRVGQFGLFLFCPGVALTFNYVNTMIPGGSTALQNGQSLIHPASRGGHEALINRDCLQHYLDVSRI